MSTLTWTRRNINGEITYTAPVYRSGEVNTSFGYHIFKLGPRDYVVNYLVSTDEGATSHRVANGSVATLALAKGYAESHERNGLWKAVA